MLLVLQLLLKVPPLTLAIPGAVERIAGAVEEVMTLAMSLLVRCSAESGLAISLFPKSSSSSYMVIALLALTSGFGWSELFEERSLSSEISVAPSTPVGVSSLPTSESPAL